MPASEEKQTRIAATYVLNLLPFLILVVVTVAAAYVIG